MFHQVKLWSYFIITYCTMSSCYHGIYIIANSASCKGSHHFYVGHFIDMVNEEHAIFHVPPIFPGDGTPALDCLLARLETGE